MSKPALTAERRKELQDKLADTQARVLKNKAACDTLHSQWRLHLLRLSYLLIVVGLYQLQTLVTQCLLDIKHVNEYKTTDHFYSGYQATSIVVQSTMQYLLGLVVAGLITLFLIHTQQEQSASKSPFSSVYYKLINALLPVVLGLHYNRPALGTDYCVDWELSQLADSNTTKGGQSKDGSLPVVVVFHIIVSASYWFMTVQAKQHTANVTLVEQMKEELLSDKDTGTTKTQSKNGTSSNKKKKTKKDK